MPDGSSQNFLIRGSDYLARFPGFKLVAREEEVKRLNRILMRDKANSVLLVGPGGVGCTALCLEIEACKSNPETPFDILSKRLFWLDTDGLFSSGNPSAMNENFQNVLRRLSRYPDTLLVIEDMKDFIEATRNHGCTHFINALMRALDQGKFQAIFESRDEHLEIVLKCHSNITELFTMLDLQEPSRESLQKIVSESVQRLEEYHKIPVSGEAVETAIELTWKYRVREMSLSRAQPERTLNLLDRALTSYRQDAHARPPLLAQKEKEAGLIARALKGENIPALVAKKPDELKKTHEMLTAQIEVIRNEWQQRQDRLRKIYKNQTDGEEALKDLEDRIEDQRKKDQEARDSAEKSLEEKAKENGKQGFQPFNMKTAAAGYESEKVNAIKAEMELLQKAIEKNKQEFETLTREINEGLELSADHVLQEFSSLSGIPANKLNQDERAKLINLDESLSNRVYGQEHAVKKLADAVRVARVGLKDPNKPQAAFMFLGPSGVGKTEMAKALTAALHDDERALLRFDMSEYMEKHAVAKLIGAPPGYEGYEAGGILTNAMRRNPYVIILFDEIEKAHPDIFNVFLQVLDDGRLTDNRGLTVSFSEAIILMTTNIGQKNFLDPAMSFEDAVQETTRELDNTYRPEFLNRFNGRQNIVCFNALDLAIIEKIATREIVKLNAQIKAQGRDLTVEITPDSLRALCKDQYNPANGARGIPGYFASQIHPAVANTMLEAENAHGVMEVIYDAKTQTLEVIHPRIREISPQKKGAA
ncbi:MAG: ATP-dependent Clp protease ATP-binding subunit [Alphaproteobacteria bacterium]|nr:ATP-dependent Clp protease ATP-binding subunit [Alphaproteobacteria bacterium]MBP7759933.1 ATP-dependent Clp protease ATP-binding subunit [Alphaproteobacteria bacterium]MBP7763287.1 ATP-dependent Clp protease ATP-binding subunit [Alphaproteobacteria bacterium]MBP7904895.1 ATP-dependent Clp protease ATP-binding subunit [Alphaproteobacteria bacterium]